MSNKGYAVLLVLAGMVCGIFLVSLASSSTEAKQPTERRNPTMNESATAPAVSVPPAFVHPDIRVYPVGTGGKDDENSYAYIVKDGKLWYCEDTMAREVNFR